MNASRIQHNTAAMNAYRNYSTNNSLLSKNLEKLSSGYKINRAGDDAAGLAISEKMRVQITGLDAAKQNAKDGISLVQTAEGALQEVHDMLNRMYKLAEQSSNGTYDNDTDREQLQKEVKSLRTEINRIADSANFNGQNLLDGSLKGVDIENNADNTGEIESASFAWGAGATTDAIKAAVKKAIYGLEVNVSVNSVSTSSGTTTATFDSDSGNTNDADIEYAVAANGTITISGVSGGAYNGLTLATISLKTSSNVAADDAATLTLATGKALNLQIGDTADSYNRMEVDIADIHDTVLGIDGIDISSESGATSAMGLIKTAINTISDIRGGLGATQNRLEHTINNLGVMSENITDSESAIRDTDVAEEMMKYTKNNIMNQAAQAMLAQANQMPQGVLQLLQ